MGKLNSEDLKMQGLIDGYLKARPSGMNPASEGSHLDEDSLAAFVDGNLNEREARPVIGHLIDCSFCRHITADLVRLDLAFAENEVISPIPENHQPARVSEVLSGLLSRIFGTSDGAVFAHQEEDEENKEAPEKKETKD
ncbi:MAG: hypothetical protein WKF92_04995 [Pyrinomonadaceae bacterium]